MSCVGSVPSREESRQVLLLRLLQSERQLQALLCAQQRLLQDVNDATARLFVVWKNKAAATEGERGLVAYHSLRELLLLRATHGNGAPAAQVTDAKVNPLHEAAAANPDCTRQLDDAIDSRIADIRSLPPSHPLLVGSLDSQTQQLLLPHLRKWLQWAAEVLPLASYECYNVHPSFQRPLAGAAAAATGTRGHSDVKIHFPKRPRDDASVVQHLTISRTALNEAQSSVLPVSGDVGIHAASPTATATHLSADFTDVCQVVWRLLEYLRLLLGMTNLVDHSPEAFHAEMRQWRRTYCVDRETRSGARYDDGGSLPLIAHVCSNGDLRSLLRFMHVDLLEIGDTLQEKARRYRAAMDDMASPAHTTSRGRSDTVDTCVGILRPHPRPKCLSVCVGAAAAVTTDDNLPSVTEVVTLSHTAGRIAEALLQCIELSG